MIDITDFSLYDPALCDMPYSYGWNPPLDAVQSTWESSVEAYITYTIYTEAFKFYNTAYYLSSGGETLVPFLNNGGVLPTLAEDALNSEPKWGNGNLRLFDTNGNIANAVSNAPILGLQIELTNRTSSVWTDNEGYQPAVEVFSDGASVDSAWLPSEIHEGDGDIPLTDGYKSGTLITVYGNDVYKRTWVVLFDEPRSDITKIEITNTFTIYSIKAITEEVASAFWTNRFKLTETGGATGTDPVEDPPDEGEGELPPGEG